MGCCTRDTSRASACHDVDEAGKSYNRLADGTVHDR
jgi:hypothetical protein